MTIDFHDAANRGTYATRDAHAGWAEAIRSLLDPHGKRVVDVGCGGGIYARAWRDLGAARVTGVDFSAQMVATATEKSAGRDGLAFRQGQAQDTGLPAASADVVFERALIHHLPRYDACFAEAARLLVPGGRLIVQDRTPEDVQVAGAPDHLRGYFFEVFPRLLAVEAGRRPLTATVVQAMRGAGLDDVRTLTLWEVRRTYDSFDELAADLAARTGRSILHELDDTELGQLIAHMRARVPPGPLVERDRWTIWSACKPA
jgi:ubiquinone/menaquinone biosynthesis C-methylase UbiE